MKKYLIVVAAVCAGITFTSCGSSKESAYRKAYEKAKAQEQAQAQAQAQTAEQTVVQPVQQYAQEQTQQSTPVVTPLTPSPAQQQTTTTAQAPASTANVSVRSERVNVINGTGLKAYSVVVGSFGVRANAEGLQNTLKNAGYDTQIAYNQERNMYRVIISTFDTKDGAVQSKQSLLGTYPDAWLLMKQ